MPHNNYDIAAGLIMKSQQLHAGLRASLTCRSRCWSISNYKENIQELHKSQDAGVEWNLDDAFDRMINDALLAVHGNIEEQIADLLQKRFSRSELEVPCARVLEKLFPGAEIERRGGPAERGADIVVTYSDPLAISGSTSGLAWRAVFQVKDWKGTASDTAALEQLAVASKHYSEEYPIRGAYLMTLCEDESKDFKAYREAMSLKLQLPVEFLGAKRLLELIREYALARVPE